MPSSTSPIPQPSELTPHLGHQIVHGPARIVSTTPLTVVTSSVQWSYALSYKPKPELLGPENALTTNLRCVFELSVGSGQIGVGWTNPEDTAFIDERFVSGANNRVTFTLRAGTRVGRLIFRNCTGGSASSTFSIDLARTEVVARHGRVYPVSVGARNLGREAIPDQGGTGIVFDTEAALAINAARIDWLERAGLPVSGSRVLDAGCGIGHFVSFYTSRQCTVVAVDGRADNIAELKRRHPAVDAHVADVQTIDPARLGGFDVIHCFGLLYHLDSPVAALRRLSDMCGRLLILETMVCDSASPVAVLVDETKAASQAMDGLGSRPSPSFIALALNRVGFDHVYGAAEVPRHPDFQFEWKDNLETTRGGVPLRCVIVASKSPLELASLTPLVEP